MDGGSIPPASTNSVRSFNGRTHDSQSCNGGFNSPTDHSECLYRLKFGAPTAHKLWQGRTRVGQSHRRRGTNVAGGRKVLNSLPYSIPGECA